MPMLLGSVLVAAAILAAVAAVHAAPAVAYRRTVIARRVVVNLITDRAFVGYIVARRGPLLIMKDVSMVADDAPAVPVDGEIVIEIGDVDFVNVLPAAKG